MLTNITSVRMQVGIIELGLVGLRAQDTGDGRQRGKETAVAESGAVPPSPRQPPPTDFAMAAAHDLRWSILSREVRHTCRNSAVVERKSW